MTVTGKTLGANIDEYDVRGTTALAAARLLTHVRAGGERTSQAWTVPSVSALAQSQTAGLALLEAEGEDGEEDADVPRGNGHAQGPTVTVPTALTRST